MCEEIVATFLDSIDLTELPTGINFTFILLSAFTHLQLSNSCSLKYEVKFNSNIDERKYVFSMLFLRFV